LNNIRVWKFANNNDLVEIAALGKNARSFDHVSAVLPQGVYTSFRTYQHFLVLHMPDHFRRLIDGAASLGSPINLDGDCLRQNLRAILAKLDGDDFRIRLSVDLENQPGDVYILVEALAIPPQNAYQLGVKTLVRPFERDTPETKYTRFIINSSPYRGLISKEINEVLLFNPLGQILEGLSSNFYGVVNSTLFTAGNGILPGITRSIVLEEAHKEGINVILEPIQLDTIQNLKEAFLTSTSRAVLPVIRIEDQTIGDGQPGEISRKLGKLYEHRIQREVESI
jgi:branched-chain amino acid aminotransferase